MAETLRLTAEKAGCIVSVSRSHVTSEACEGPWSSSGVILAQESGIVICHGAVFSPFLLSSERQDGLYRKVLLGESFSSDLQIQVMRPSEWSSETPTWNWLSGDLGSQLPVLRFNPLSNQQGASSGQRCWEAKLVMMVPCPQFWDAFSKVFSAAEQWHFGGDEVGEDSSSVLEKNGFLHWFAILRLMDYDFHGPGWLSCMPAKLLRKGDPVFTCGSPFGSFCPDIFMNSLSKGIVSNMAGEDNALILTDARCLPGTEGGGVFTGSGNCVQLVGIIVAPLCWKSTEWVGLTLVCAISHILENVRSLLSGSHPVLNNWPRPVQLVTELHGNAAVRDRLIQQMLSAVVLVECGPTWGSGVVVGPRLVLTCRHVVSGASPVCVRLQPNPEKTSVVNGKVVFATKDSCPYDVALVELEESFVVFAEPALARTFCTGEDVSIVGFGVFGRACGPSITSGILSAVITVEDKPVMLQATCAVHGGSSGGALFATHSGKLLGIVASNTRDNSIGVTYPHLNFSIPITVLQQAIFEYVHTGSLRGFQELDRVDNKVHIVWRLQREPIEVPLSKL